MSAANPVISPEGTDEGINASDPDLVECGDTTRLYYAVGDQRTWMDIKYAEYDGGLDDFLAYLYATPGIPDCGAVSAP